MKQMFTMSWYGKMMGRVTAIWTTGLELGMVRLKGTESWGSLGIGWSMLQWQEIHEQMGHWKRV